VANHASAEKRNRQRVKSTARNRAVKSEFRTLVKAVREALTNGNLEAAQAALKPATSALDAAAAKGVLHRATASRRVSRIVSAVHKAAAEKKG
jgi:small subunit ribosomal protein S20